MQNMAGGGIVAFDDGGEVPGYRTGGTPEDEYSDEFNRAYKRLLKVEGGYVANDAGMGPTMYGVNWSANKNTLKKLGYTEDTVKNLTPKDAKQIYKRDYWDAIGGDKLAKKDFNFANVAFDGAANQGVPTIKPMLAKAGNDPYKLLELRQQRYEDLATPKEKDTPAQAERRKEHQKSIEGWRNRTAALKNEIDANQNNPRLPGITPGAQATAATPKVAPQAQAQGITALTGDDNFTDPMTGFSPTQAPVGEKPRVLSKEGARQAMLGVGDLPYAFAGATSDIGNAVVRGLTLGRYNEPEPTLGSAHLKRLATEYLGREADSTDPAMRNMRTAGEITGTFINPVTGLRTAAKKTEAGLNALFGGQKAKEAEAVAATPAKMPLRLTMAEPPIPVTPAGQTAASVAGAGGRSVQETQQAVEAARLANQARDQLAANQLAKQAARYAEPNPLLAETAKVASPGEKAARAVQIAGETAVMAPKTLPFAPEGIAALTPNENIGESVFDPTFGGKMPLPAPPKEEFQGLGIKDLPKDPVTGGMDMNRLMMQMGLHLMAGKSPNALTNVGEAGIGALNMQQAEAKALSERESKMSEAEYRKAMGKYYDASTASIERGAKEKNLNLEAEKLIAQKMKELPTLVQAQLAGDPTRLAAVEKNIRQEIYRQLGITPTMAAGAPTGGAKFLGFENPA
jgi:lysozyme family protein